MAGVKHWIKRVRAVPAVNAPLTHTLRGVSPLLGVRRELFIKHVAHVGMTRMDLPNGYRAKLWSRGDDWVSNQVFWRGWDGYEPEVTSVFWPLAREADVTIDVGAHVGFYTILAALANPGATVYAFEPLPAVFERLVRNVRMNALENVRTVCRAAGAFDGKADFFHVPDVIPCSSSLSESFMHATPGVKSLCVDVVKLDTFLEQQGVKKIDFMKVDTETTEPDVFSGMRRTLARDRPEIVCEILPGVDADAITATLRPLGYQFYLLTDTGPVPRERVTSHGRWLNYLFSTRSDRVARCAA